VNDIGGVFLAETTGTPLLAPVLQQVPPGAIFEGHAQGSSTSPSTGFLSACAFKRSSASNPQERGWCSALDICFERTVPIR
jgi:hypothetical protein